MNIIPNGCGGHDDIGGDNGGGDDRGDGIDGVSTGFGGGGDGDR